MSYSSLLPPRVAASFVLLLLLGVLAHPSSAQVKQAEALEPDTHAARRLSDLLKCLSNPNKSERDKRVVALFTDEEDPADLERISTTVFQETGGIKVKEIKESEAFEIETICATKKGPLLKVSIEVTESKPHLISNIQFSRYQESRLAKRVGDLVPVFDEQHQTLEAARGTWLAKGYGYIMEVKSDGVDFYDYTSRFGWKAKEDEGEDSLEMLFKAGDSKDTATITFHPKEPGFHVTRLEGLPAECTDKTNWTPTRLFDLFADVMTTHYPFFEARNVDWQARIESHRPRISDDMSESALFDVMESMLLDLNDGHTGLRAEIDGKERVADTGDSPTIRRLMDALKNTPDVEQRGEMFSKFVRGIDKCIMEKVLSGKGQKCCARQISWGRADKRVGYVEIQSMGGYSLGDTDHQVEALHAALDEILSELSDTDALIIDITKNGGGSDLFSLEIASHFTDKKRLGFSKWPASAKQYRNDRHVTPRSEVDPNAVTYLNPVFLVTSDYSASAAEIFTMCMRAMPQVTTVGTATSGALSDVLNKTLPNGWHFHTSNEVYVDHEGVCHEGPGIPPMVELQIFDPDDVLNVVHDKVIAEVVALALEKAAN